MAMRIQVKNLHKSFGNRAVLKGVDLDVPPGQLCVIVGASGTGKSVLLKHIVGLIKPDSGSILIDGEDVVPLSESKMMKMRHRFGMIFQNGGLLQSITVGQNVGMALEEIAHEKPEKIREQVASTLKEMGLEGREDQLPTTLSGGQRKRAAIARALISRADCFLFDEPTAGLDPIMSENVDEVVKRVNKNTGATTIVVTHDLVSVFALADMVHMLYEGKIIASAPPAEFRKSTDERVREFFSREIPAALV